MSAGKFCCQYVNSAGAVVTEVVFAYTESAAIRAVMLKHPLAKDVCVVDPAKSMNLSGNKANSGRYGTVSASREPMDKRMIVMIIGLLTLCLSMFAVVLLLLLRGQDQGEKANVANVLPDKSNVGGENRYADDYKNIVSISSRNSISTGFKLKTEYGVYLYTCFHCIVSDDAVVCRDSKDNQLRLGGLELCCNRDLVRFELPDEDEGFELAGDNDLQINKAVIAYGDTSGRGVMTQNKGRILAVGNHKIEIDSAVLSGNSGGPVLTESGKVVGVISSGSVDNTIWAKDTRYEKVRKFAERADNADWHYVSYDEFRENYAYLHDTYVAIQEFRELVDVDARNGFGDKIVRPFVNDQRYVGSFGYPGIIKRMYQARNDMADAEQERQRKWNETNGRVGTAVQENQYYDVVKKRNLFYRQCRISLPLQMLNSALEELEAMDLRYFVKSRKELLMDIKTILIPAVVSFEKEIAKLELEAHENYEKDFKKVK